MRRLKLRLITFDVTGTLLMTKLVEHYEIIGAQYGLSIDKYKLARSFKVNYKRMSKEHPVYGKNTGLGWENWWKIIVHNVFKDQNSKISQQTLDKIAANLIECYSTNKCWHKYPDTHKLLQYLATQNVTLGVISNFDERLESILQSTGIRSYFNFVITSYDLGVEKPNPLIFAKALNLSKDKLSPEEALHVGNSVDLDYFGAKKVGWNSILINHDHDNNDDDNDRVSDGNIVRNLGELKIRLSQMLEK